jgi:hypothetical protein
MILGMIILALELPLPVVKRYALYRSFVARFVLLIFQVFLNMLYYQVSSFGCHAPLVRLIRYPGNKRSPLVSHRCSMLLSGFDAWGNLGGIEEESW